jgi:hypothetical protein
MHAQGQLENKAGKPGEGLACSKMEHQARTLKSQFETPQPLTSLLDCFCLPFSIGPIPAMRHRVTLTCPGTALMDAAGEGAWLEFVPLPQQPGTAPNLRSTAAPRKVNMPAEEGSEALASGSQISYVETVQSLIDVLPADTPHTASPPAIAHGLFGQQAPLTAMARALGGDCPLPSGFDTGSTHCGFNVVVEKDSSSSMGLAAAPEHLQASPDYLRPACGDGLPSLAGRVMPDVDSGDALTLSREGMPLRPEATTKGESLVPGVAQAVWTDAATRADQAEAAFPLRQLALVASGLRRAYAHLDRPASPTGPVVATLFRPSGASQTQPEGDCGRGPQPAVERLLAADSMAGSDVTVAGPRLGAQLATASSPPHPGVGGRPPLEALAPQGSMRHADESYLGQTQVASVSADSSAVSPSEGSLDMHQAPNAPQKLEPGDRGPAHAMAMLSTTIKPRSPEIRESPIHRTHLAGMSVLQEKKDDPLEGRGPIREIRLVVHAATGKQVSLSFSENSGGVKVTASTPDRQLAEGLIAELGALKSLGYEELQTGQGQARYALHRQLQDTEHDHTGEPAERAGTDQRDSGKEDSHAEDERESLVRWLDAMDYQAQSAPVAGIGDER